MNILAQELTTYRVEFEEMVASWNALSLIERKREWVRYLEMLDAGDSGYHPFARVLLNAWCGGWDATQGFTLRAHGLLAPAGQVDEAA